MSKTYDFLIKKNFRKNYFIADFNCCQQCFLRFFQKNKITKSIFFKLCFHWEVWALWMEVVQFFFLVFLWSVLNKSQKNGKSPRLRKIPIFFTFI
jgi:hypothetical protein